jgi:deoxyhypusine monooxygenase
MKQILSREESERVGLILNDQERQLAERFRALFTLRNVTGPQAVFWISQPLLNDNSALLKHECAFCLGQMQDPLANETLIQVLRNKNEHPMVRHEAGEALGAIGSIESLEVLKEFSSDAAIEVAQTCQLAVKRIMWTQTDEAKTHETGTYNSVDPTPPAESTLSLVQLRDLLLRSDSTLHDKYRAMFALRNNGSSDAIRVLGEGLVLYRGDKSNALLKHEIAYVLGQVQSPESVPYLRELLEDKDENEMVRHECAEALGSIASNDANDILLKYRDDDVKIVKESIEVALDMSEYEKNESQFHFMDNLLKSSV